MSFIKERKVRIKAIPQSIRDIYKCATRTTDTNMVKKEVRLSSNYF